MWKWFYHTQDWVQPAQQHYEWLKQGSQHFFMLLLFLLPSLEDILGENVIITMNNIILLSFRSLAKQTMSNLNFPYLWSPKKAQLFREQMYV